MKVTFEVSVLLNHEEIAREGKRRGFRLARAYETVIADVENSLFDSLRHKDAIARVGVVLTGGAGEGTPLEGGGTGQTPRVAAAVQNLP